MFHRTRVMSAVVAGSAVLVLAIIGALAEQQALPVDNGMIITSAQAAVLSGGGHECGCEELSNRCDGQEDALCRIVNPMGPPDPGEPGHWLYQGSACTTCQHNSNREKCADWGWCIGWTCTKCVEDPTFQCGTRSLGVCNLGNCQIAIQDDGYCGTNFQCHTEDQ